MALEMSRLFPSQNVHSKVSLLVPKCSDKKNSSAQKSRHYLSVPKCPDILYIKENQHLATEQLLDGPENVYVDKINQ
jgi:hypothetical protein